MAGRSSVRSGLLPGPRIGRPTEPELARSLHSGILAAPSSPLTIQTLCDVSGARASRPCSHGSSPGPRSCFVSWRRNAAVKSRCSSGAAPCIPGRLRARCGRTALASSGARAAGRRRPESPRRCVPPDPPRQGRYSSSFSRTSVERPRHRGVVDIIGEAPCPRAASARSISSRWRRM